jgi:toxin CptA
VQFPVLIELHHSRLLLLLLLSIHVVALACVLVLPWPWAIRVFLAFPIVLSAWNPLRGSGIVALRLSEQAGLECIVATGNRMSATLMPDSAVFSRLIVLRLRLDGEKRIRNLPLLPDSLSAEQFRVLRLWLRWRARERAGNDA